LTLGAPPVTPVAEQARREGALLDLDKHDWPWSMALVPIMKVDLYELANNHLWRTEFGMSKWDGAAEDFVGHPGEGCPVANAIGSRLAAAIITFS